MSDHKINMPVQVLCTVHKGSTEKLATYLNHVRALQFDEKPDYAYLRKSVMGSRRMIALMTGPRCSKTRRLASEIKA